MYVQRGVNGQRGLKPLSLDGPCNSRLSSSLTLSDGGNYLSVVGVGEGVNLVSSSSQAPAGLAVHQGHQGRKEPQNWAQDTQGRAAGFQTRCHLDYFLTQCSQPEPLLVALAHPVLGPPYLPEDFRYPGGSMFLPSWRQQTWTQF